MFSSLTDFSMSLFACALGHAVGERGAQKLSDWVRDRLHDRSNRLLEALTTAYERAWQTIEYALTRELTVIGQFASADEKARRKEMAQYLDRMTGPQFTPHERAACLDELHRAWDFIVRTPQGWMLQQDGQGRLAEQAVLFSKGQSHPLSIVETSTRAVMDMSEILKDQGYHLLARLIASGEEGSPPLLAAAFTHFFRAEVTASEELSREVTLARLETLSSLPTELALLAHEIKQMKKMMRSPSEASTTSEPSAQPAQAAFSKKLDQAAGVIAAWNHFAADLASVLAQRLTMTDPAVLDRAAGLEVNRARLQKRLEEASRQFKQHLTRPEVCLATTGTTSSGKSALVNLLCGAEIMPVAVGEMSAGVVTLHHASERRLIIEATEGADWRCGTWEGVSDDQIRDLLTEVMERYNARRDSANEPACPSVILHYPTRLGMRQEVLGLPQGCSYRLLDLPGLKYIGDKGNGDVIRRSAREALCLVLYNSAEVDPHKQAELLQQVAGQVKELGGSPARMLFILNRIDVFRQDLTGARNEEEFVYRTGLAIRNVLLRNLPEHEQAIESITPLKLSTLPALLAQQVLDRTGKERLDALQRLDRDFRNMIPENLIEDLPRKLEKWKETDMRAVAEAVSHAAHADAFYDHLRRHIQNHLPDLVIPQAVDRFRAHGGREAAEWALLTARSELNSTRERYEQECQAIEQTGNDLRELRLVAARRLREPFEKIRDQLTSLNVSDQDGVKHAINVIRKELEVLSQTDPYDRMPKNSLAPLHTWRADLALVVERVIEAIGTALLRGEALSGDVIEQLPSGTRRGLVQAITALQEAGYNPQAARNGATLRADDEAGRQRLRAINAALVRVAERLCPAMEDVVHRASRNEVRRVFDAMERLFDHHKADVTHRAQTLAPGIGLEMTEARLEMIERDLATAYVYDAKIHIESAEEKIQTGSEKVQTGTKTERRVIGTRSWWNPVGWVYGREIEEVVTTPVFAQRPVYGMRSYEYANLPPFKTLAEDWNRQTRQHDPELILQFIEWLLTQADQVSDTIDVFQDELLQRYQMELDRAHAAARALNESDVAAWTPVLQKAEALEAAFNEFSNLV